MEGRAGSGRAAHGKEDLEVNDNRQVIDKNGERGRNLTFNLLFVSQTLKMNDFNEFPMI